MRRTPGESGRGGRPGGAPPPLPPAIVALVEAVLRAAELDFTEGRAAVELELRARWVDGAGA